MASLMEMLGVNNTGLGSAVSGIEALEQSELNRAKSLADLMTARQAQQSAAIQQQRDALTLERERALNPSAIEVGLAENQGKLGKEQLMKLQQLGERVSQTSSLFEKIAPEQRQQYLQQMAQTIPGIANSPEFQQLLSVDPANLPMALSKLGNDIMLRTGDQLRAMEKQKAADDAAMARVQAQEAGATSRQQALFAHQMALEQERIAAGKYDKASILKDPVAAIYKMGPEKMASVALFEMQTSTDPAEKEKWRVIGQGASQLASQFRSAGATPQPMIVPGQGLTVQDVYGRTGAYDPFATGFNQPQATQNDQQIRQAVEAAGVKYEPDKYEYRINPQTNKLQRKAK